jgi:hypothetical protein
MSEDRPWIAEILRETAEMEAAARQTADELDSARRRRRGRAGRSVVYSVRLDPAEVAALERRAKPLGIGPTVLARNLIRMGLGGGGREDLADAIRRAADAVEDIQAATS